MISKNLSSAEKLHLAAEIEKLLTARLGNKQEEEKLCVLDIVASLIVPCAMVKIYRRES